MSQTIAATELRPEDVLLVAGRIRMRVGAVKADDYGVEEGTTLYVEGPDGLTDIYRYQGDERVEVIRG